jgi:hypothetical protein
VAERRETARKEAKEIHASAADEAEAVLARARSTLREILALAHNEATEITSAACQRIPSTVSTQPWMVKRPGGQRNTSWTRPGPTPPTDVWRVVDDYCGQAVGKLQAESMMSTAASIFPQ